MNAKTPAIQTTEIGAGDAHSPVTSISDPDPGAPATQLTDNGKMPQAFDGSCIESAKGGLQPRVAPILPQEISPNREAPRKPHPGDRRPT